MRLRQTYVRGGGGVNNLLAICNAYKQAQSCMRR